jgi:hypothetical protein
MVRDYLYWRDDLDFVRGHLPAVRQLIESFLPMLRPDGCMGALPGWPFIDWVDHWREGCGPGVREGDASLLSLHWVLTLQAAAEIEEAVGEAVLATRCRDSARSCMQALLARYWSETRGCLLDTVGRPDACEHAQALALLTGLAGPARDARMLEALASDKLETRCTIYFSFYLLEALTRYARADLFFNRLADWRIFPGRGFVTLPEKHDPSRSDCHAWTAHPLYHSYAGIAGIRPAAPGFRQVRITPMPGPLKQFVAEALHPRGRIRVSWNHGELQVELPPGVERV